jgi:hypothetical protein
VQVRVAVFGPLSIPVDAWTYVRAARRILRACAFSGWLGFARGGFPVDGGGGLRFGPNRLGMLPRRYGGLARLAQSVGRCSER